jgi:hypothetical protein
MYHYEAEKGQPQQMHCSKTLRILKKNTQSQKRKQKNHILFRNPNPSSEEDKQKKHGPLND